MDYKILFGAAAVLLSFIGYVPYFRDMYLGKTKPHAFSWLLWAIMSGIGFVAQVKEGAGAGSWVLGFSGLICLIVFILALFVGEKDIVLVDWICLFVAFGIIVFWQLTSDTLTAVILLTIADAVSFAPTIRKSYIKPFEETLIEYFLSGLKYLIGLFAITSFTFVNWLYPASLMFMNFLFYFLILYRRKQVKSSVQ